MHFITDGFQEYEVNGRRYTLESGCFLIIYPGVSHTVIDSAPHTKKYSITFDKHSEKSQDCLKDIMYQSFARNRHYFHN